MMKVEFGTRHSGLAMIATLTLVGLISACQSKTPSATVELFPQTGEVVGWSKAHDSRTFPAANLWEYIDGDAERYIQAGVEKTLTCDYRYRNQTDAVADIHVMKTVEGPKKLLESEWSVDAQRVAVGEDARLYATSLVFRKGRYLVRVVAYEEAPEVSAALVQLGQAIEKKLAPTG